MWRKGIARLGQRREILPVMLIRLHISQTHPVHCPEGTYKRNTAVVARMDLRLIRINKDLGMTQRPAASIAANNPAFRPPHRLFMDQINRRHGLRLSELILANHPTTRHQERDKPGTP